MVVDANRHSVHLLKTNRTKHKPLKTAQKDETEKLRPCTCAHTYRASVATNSATAAARMNTETTKNNNNNKDELISCQRTKITYPSRNKKMVGLEYLGREVIRRK